MFFRANEALSLPGKKLKNTYESLELTAATVIHHTLSKLYDVI